VRVGVLGAIHQLINQRLCLLNLGAVTIVDRLKTGSNAPLIVCRCPDQVGLPVFVVVVLVQSEERHK
jgi:hypothetical protein